MLANFFGTDKYTFTMTSTFVHPTTGQTPQNPRVYSRFSDAADDVVDARIYEGIYVDVAFDHGVITLKNAQAKVQDGSIKANGQAKVAGLKPQSVELRAEAHHFPIPTGTFGAWLDATVTVHGEQTPDGLAGTVVVEKGTANLPKLAAGKKLQSTGPLEDVKFVDAAARREEARRKEAEKEPATTELVAKIPDDAPPGFYHVFARIDAGDAGVSYGWQEIRKPAAPAIDKEHGVHPEVTYDAGALDYDFNRSLAVVYGKDATGWEVESAWLLYQTLESATGRPVKIYQLNDLPPQLGDDHLIAVGTPTTNPLVGAAPQNAKAWVAATSDQRLIVGGVDEANLNLAAIDLVLRYWKNAKGSGCRRIPLTDQPIKGGPDPSALP